MNRTEEIITLLIQYWDGKFEVVMTGTGRLDVDARLAAFSDIEDAREFCKAFESCSDVQTVEDVIFEP